MLRSRNTKMIARLNCFYLSFLPASAQAKNFVSQSFILTTDTQITSTNITTPAISKPKNYWKIRCQHSVDTKIAVVDRIQILSENSNQTYKKEAQMHSQETSDMRKVFWDDPYQCTLDTTVTSVNGNEVLFKETIAYSESGGQESDKATVNGIQIISSRKDDEKHLIYYTLPEGHGLSEGDKVTMEIDWARRNRLMRLHFACELVLVLVNRLFGKKDDSEMLHPDEIDKIGPEKVGAHMSEDRARVDFKMAEAITSYIPKIKEEYKKIIDADHPIETGFTDEKNQVRYWRIAGFAEVPCGGTHVKSTKEVGDVNLKRERANKGVERVRITLFDPSVPDKKVSEPNQVKEQSNLSSLAPGFANSYGN